MFLIQRWDNVVIERTTTLELALTVAEHESAKRPESRIDVVEHWDEREDIRLASYRAGHLIPQS